MSAGQPISVLHAIDGLNIGGAERLLVSLVKSFDPARVRPVVCVTRSFRESGHDLQGIPVEVLDRRSTWDPRGFAGVHRVVKAHRIDVIHAHGYSTGSFFAAAKLLAGVRKPLLVHGHSSTAPPWRLTVATSQIDHLIAVSEEVMTWAAVRLGFKGDRATLLENGIDLQEYPGQSQARWTTLFDPVPRFLGVAVANVRPLKDIHTLLRGIAHCRHRHQLGLIIAGSLQDQEYVDSCRRLTAELNLEQTIAFVGEVRGIPDLLSSVDFGLLTSTSETGPLALLEYMAAGVPFVATRVGQVARTCEAFGMTGFASVGSVTEVAASLDRLLSASVEERSKAAEAGRALVNSRYDIRNRADQLDALYNRLVAWARPHSTP